MLLPTYTEKIFWLRHWSRRIQSIAELRDDSCKSSFLFVFVCLRMCLIIIIIMYLHVSIGLEIIVKLIM